MRRWAEPVLVEFYAGGRGEEVPRAVWVGAERVPLARVVDSRFYETHPERIRRRRIVVDTACGQRWTLTHDEATATWWLERDDR